MESRQNGHYIALLEEKVNEMLKKAKENFHTKALRHKEKNNRSSLVSLCLCVNMLLGLYVAWFNKTMQIKCFKIKPQ